MAIDTAKEKRITKENKKLHKIFKDLDLDRQRTQFLESTINNLAFMAIALEDLQAEINENGYTEIYTNGANQCGVKDSAALKAYNNLIKNYNMSIKTVSAFLPDNNNNPVHENKLAKLLMQND